MSTSINFNHELNQQLRMQINANKVELDKKQPKNPVVHKGVQLEKRTHKKEWGSPAFQKQRDELIQTFLSSKTPNWGNITFLVRC